MPAKSRRVQLAEWLQSSQPASIGEREFGEIATALAPISPSYLRKLIRDSGAPLAPMIEGVRQSNLDELERTLLALLHEYQNADHVRRSAVRHIVIEAKDHARLALRKTEPEKAAVKQEMILWMLTWLENPPLFADWIRLRRASLP